MTWRDIRPGEDVREYHRTVELPFKIAGMVDYVCRLPTNAERGRFLRGLAKVQSEEFADRIRREVWRRLRERA